jgi:hypothetical protein
VAYANVTDTPTTLKNPNALSIGSIKTYDGSSAVSVTKDDITGLGIPGSDTTYSEMTGTTLGLVKLNGTYTFTGTINVPTPTLV